MLSRSHCEGAGLHEWLVVLTTPANLTSPLPFSQVARKVEPHHAALLFPISLLGPPARFPVEGADESKSGVKTGSLLAYPAHLVHECLMSGRFATAAWYLPLIRLVQLPLTCF